MTNQILKIKAFTLTELLVVIAISSIVVGLAYSVLGLITQNVQNIQDNYSDATHLRLFEEQFSVDFQKFPTVNYSDYTKALVLSSPLDSITYTFEKEVVLRGEDSIFIVLKEPKYYFKGKAISKGAIDAIKFTTSDSLNNRSFFIFKYTDALNTMADGN
tara:strand:- start:409978 stop:410454 length:477 start_codon:yes stop_codon:yes gene_type:complete